MSTRSEQAGPARPAGHSARHGHPRPDPHVIVLFGATGDLARRKLLPGLHHLFRAGLLPEQFRIIGSAPPEFAHVGRGVPPARRGGVQPVRQLQARRVLGLVRLQAVVRRGVARGPSALVSAVEAAEKAISAAPAHRRNGNGNGNGPAHIGRLFHLAVPPSAFVAVVRMLGSSGLANESARVIIEKPFGTDLESSKQLNAAVHEVFDESRIFRIDHFLGKESVDNILAFRFANGLFEPIWNRDHIKYVQIDVPETLTVEQRAALLRRDRRLPGHGGDAPVPGARLHRDGAADVAGRQAAARREGQGVRRAAADRPAARRARASTRATGRFPGCPPTPTPRP